MLDEDLIQQLVALGEDRTSGASELVRALIDILGAARERGQVESAAAFACRAQPSMALIWNAAVHAIADVDRPGTLATFAARTARGPSTTGRYVDEAFPERPDGGWRIATLSASGSVRACLDHLRELGDLHVFCSESRPALEGRHLASALTQAGVEVTLYSDAGIGDALASVHAVLLGADAIGPHAALNKVGSEMLAQAAYARGVPVYLVASRDKFTTPALWSCLSIRDGAPDEVWPEAPPRVRVRNPYFEEVSLSVVTGLLTDLGLLNPDMVPAVCSGQDSPQLRSALDRLRRRLAEAAVSHAGPPPGRPVRGAL